MYVDTALGFTVSAINTSVLFNADRTPALVEVNIQVTSYVGVHPPSSLDHMHQCVYTVHISFNQLYKCFENYH